MAEEGERKEVEERKAKVVVGGGGGDVPKGCCDNIGDKE
jgi:hypothetical protein